MANYRVKIGSVDAGLSVQVMPLGWDAILEWKREADSANYTFNPKGDFLLNCARLPAAWGPAAPDIFQALIDEEENCTSFEVAIEIECPKNSGTWEEVWAGSFSSKDWKRNNDQKTISVKAKETNPLQCLRENWKTQKNIYNVGTWQTVRPYLNEYEKYTEVIDQPLATPCGDPPVVSGYCFYSKESKKVGTDEKLCIYHYHRFKKAGTCSGATPVEPDTFNSWTILTNSCPGSSLWWTCPASTHLPWTFIHGQRLQDIIEFLVDETGCGLTVKSDFFDLNADATAPSNAAYTAAADYCQNLIVFQKSDVKRHDATNPATQPAFVMKLADLLADLKLMFNLDWRITDSGATLRIEHVSYFEAGAGNDYSAARYTRELLQDKADAPRLTRFQYRDEPCTSYFKGSPLEIYCGEDEKDFRLTLFSCDISYITSNDAVDNVGDDGFVLMAAVDVGGNLYNVDNNQGLSWSELLYNFYRHNMAGAGEINGAPVTPLSLKKTRKQPAFVVPHCCDDSFDPSDLHTTDLGDGQVDSALWNIAQDYIELELKY